MDSLNWRQLSEIDKKRWVDAVTISITIACCGEVALVQATKVVVVEK